MPEGGRAAHAGSLRNSAITVGGGFGVQAAVLVSGILVARLLGVEDRGHLALLWVLALALTFVATTGLPASTTYWVARDPGGSRRLGRLIVRVGVVQAILATAAQACVLALVVGDDEGYVQAAAVISLVVVPCMVACLHSMAFLQGLEQFKGWSAIRVLPALVYALVVLGFAVGGGAGLVAVTAAWVSGYVLCAFVAVRRAVISLPKETPGPQPSFAALQRFGAKAFLGTASPSDTLQLDQALVGLFLSPAALGLYVVGLAFTNLPRIVAQSVGFVAFPHVARQEDPQAARRAMWFATGATAVVVAAIVGALELTSGLLVPFLFGPEFGDAVELTRILLAAAAVVSVRRVLADGARGAGYPGLGTAAEVASSMVLIPLMAVLAGGLGVTGVAIALVIAAVVGLGFLLVGLALSSPRSDDDHGSAVSVGTDVPDPAHLGEGPR